VAVGRPGEELGVVDLAFAAATVAWMALEDDAAPAVLNLIDPAPPTRRALIERLKHDNPTVKVLWVPRAIIVPTLNAAGRLNALLRSGGAHLEADEIFGHRDWDVARISELEDRIRRPLADQSQKPPPQPANFGLIECRSL
jgi:hypothetical protein